MDWTSFSSWQLLQMWSPKFSQFPISFFVPVTGKSIPEEVEAGAKPPIWDKMYQIDSDSNMSWENAKLLDTDFLGGFKIQIWFMSIIDHCPSLLLMAQSWNSQKRLAHCKAGQLQDFQERNDGNMWGWGSQQSLQSVSISHLGVPNFWMVFRILNGTFIYINLKVPPF